MATTISTQDLIDVKRDIDDIGKAVNENVIVSPRYGEDFKSLPMIAAEAQGAIDEWGWAIALITQDGGVPALAVSDASGVTQQDINDLTGAPYRIKVGGYNIGERVVLENGDIVKSTVANNTVNPNTDMTGWVLETIRSVATPTSLSSINNPKHHQRVYVDSLQKNFIYDENLTLLENGVTVIGKWEMQIQEAYYASWFCEAESGVDESNKLQTGYTYATSKNRAFIIDIKVDVLPKITGGYNGNKTAIKVLDNSCLIFNLGVGQIRMLPNSLENYYLISTYQAKNFAIFNADLVGDRLTHDYSSGGTHEWGYGLAIYECENGYFHKPKISNTTGDGIYVGKSWGEPTDAIPTNITIFRPTIDRVRRNGFSLTAAKDLFVESLVISNVGTSGGILGTNPMAGIDIEPEAASPINLNLINCRLNNTTINDCSTGIDITLISESSINLDVAFTGKTTINHSVDKHVSIISDNPLTVGLIEFSDLFVKGNPSVTDMLWCCLKTPLNIVFRNLNKSGVFKFSQRLNVVKNFSKPLGSTEIYSNSDIYLDSIWELPTSSNIVSSLLIESSKTVSTQTNNKITYESPCVISGSSEVNNGNISTNRIPTNKIVANLFAGNPCNLLINDSRVFVISLSGGSYAGQYLILSGFSFTDNSGAVFSSVRTNERGARMVCQKQADGSLRIIEMLGAWAFQ